MISLVNKELKIESIKNHSNSNIYIDIKDIKELVSDSKTKDRIFNIGINVSVIIFIILLFSGLYYFREDISKSYNYYDDNTNMYNSSPIKPYNFFKFL